MNFKFPKSHPKYDFRAKLYLVMIFRKLIFTEKSQNATLWWFLLKKENYEFLEIQPIHELSPYPHPDFTLNTHFTSKFKGTIWQGSTCFPSSSSCNVSFIISFYIPCDKWILHRRSAYGWWNFWVSHHIYYVIRNDDVIFRYVCYDMIHYYTHHGSIRKGSWIDKIRKYHIDHHFIDPNKGKSCYVMQK